jgi:hypothetical protein
VNDRLEGVPGWYGKIASLGDFASRRLSPDFISRWDGWLQQVMSASRGHLGEAWLNAYLTSPVWRFILFPGVCGESSWVGVFMPSVDKVALPDGARFTAARYRHGTPLFWPPRTNSNSSARARRRRLRHRLSGRRPLAAAPGGAQGVHAVVAGVAQPAAGSVRSSPSATAKPSRPACAASSTKRGCWRSSTTPRWSRSTASGRPTAPPTW